MSMRHCSRPLLYALSCTLCVQHFIHFIVKIHYLANTELHNSMHVLPASRCRYLNITYARKIKFDLNQHYLCTRRQSEQD